MALQLGTNVHPPAPYLNQERLLTVSGASVIPKINYPEVVVVVYEATVVGTPIFPTL
jgi:hypothetical protein